MTSLPETRATWLAQLFSTEPANRARAESGVRRLYREAGFGEPKHFVWFESPFAATWAVALLIAPHNTLWRDKLSSGLSKADQQRLDAARASLAERLGESDARVLSATMGAPRGGSLQWPPSTSRMFAMALLTARHALVTDISELFAVRGEDDDLARAENYFWGGNRGALRSALHCPTTDALIGQSFYNEYSFSMMADDDHRARERQTAALLQAAWDVAQSCGLWWPFENGAILSERPAEVHVNEQKLLHRADGPAVMFRDGRVAYAWNGKAVPERWILQPESVPPREYKGFDPTFRKFIESRGRAAGAKTAGKRAKPVSLFKTALPLDPSQRLERLREHAAGRLSLLERYRAGEHRQVWQELTALGAAVREEPHAADALAVAYETMRLVAENVRMLVERLTAIGYKPANRPHVPPAGGIQKTLIDFEKSAGPLPLSLRAFYEVVGEVNLIGTHPRIAPRGGSVAPDPLVVYGFDEGVVEFDDEVDGDESPSALVIAPDDLHKADVSGGDAYEMAIPDPRADGELVNERHRLMFVDYLRLCFRYGGFPGYDGHSEVPAELAALSDGLREF